MIDQISFQEQSDDISYGRVTDGSYSWQLFNLPTPGSSNIGGSPCQTGDINCDDQVDILDIVSMINLIFEDEYDPNADVNGDNTIDILDVILVVDIIINN